MLFASLALLLHMAVASGVAVIFSECAIRDDENLHKFKESAPCPKRFTVVTPNLVECFAHFHTTAFQLHMHQWQTVDKDSYIVAVFVAATLWHILVDYLKRIVVDIFFVDEIHVQKRPIVASEYLFMVFLNGAGFFHDALVGIAEVLFEKRLPLLVGELDLIEFFKLRTQVGYQVGFTLDRQIFVGLALKSLDEIGFHSRFALVLGRAVIACFKFGNHGRFRVF